MINKSAKKMLDLHETLALILNETLPITEIKSINVEHSLNYIAAKNIYSPIDLPPFNNSAMDGFAVKASDFDETNELTLQNEVFAGDLHKIYCKSKHCIRITTGSRLPENTDSVVMLEDTEEQQQTIRFLKKPTIYENVRFKGEDFTKNSQLLQQGDKLTIPSLSLLFALGITSIPVYRKPKVAIFSTGNELKKPGEPLKEGEIYDSNRFAINLMLNELNCDIFDYGILPDSPEIIEKNIQEMDNKVDLIVSSGGVSAGKADFVKQILQKNKKIQTCKINIKPGKPFLFGRIQQSLYCGLPGNPISAFVTFYYLVQPLIQKLSGQNSFIMPKVFRVKSASDLQKSPGRLEFQRGILSYDEKGELEVTTTGNQNSHLLSSLYRANCFIILEKNRGNVRVGEFVNITYFNSLLS